MLKVPRVNSIVLTKAGANPDIINVCANIKSKAIGNGMNVPMKEIRLKLARLMGTPINLSKFPHPQRFHHAGPTAGQHNHEILSEFGYDADTIEQLEQSGAI